MGILVKAKQIGYYANSLKQEGTLFELEEKDLLKDKDGKIVSPKWIELYEENAEAKSAPVEVKKESKKSKDSVI